MCDSERCWKVEQRHGGTDYDQHLTLREAAETLKEANEAFQREGISFVITRMKDCNARSVSTEGDR